MIDTLPMNERVKKLWVEALRSGNYQQGKDGLKTSENNYCCLGVLCELHRQEVNEYDWDAGYQPKFQKYYGQTAYLPSPVCEWAGLTVSNPVIDGNPLAYLNDHMKSFDEIADLIDGAL